jgi:tetratricopeptide (TPR) repeat protein
MDKKTLREKLTAKLKQEMSTTGTGASVTPGVGAGVATKYAFAPKKDGDKIAKDYIKTFGGTLAPKVPNRPSKAIDYKELFEDFKEGDKVTYLGHPGEITKINKEMTGAITYNVSYDKGNGKTKASNIYNKDGEIKPLKEGEYNSLAGMLAQLGAEEDAVKVLVKAVEMGALKPTDAIEIVKKTVNLNEGYAQFRNETKMRSKPDQFHQAVKQVKKKVNEINRLFEYMDRLKTELSEGEVLKNKKYTESAIGQIKEATKKLFFKAIKLK